MENRHLARRFKGCISSEKAVASYADKFLSAGAT
jgi:hypothetical protein